MFDRKESLQLKKISNSAIKMVAGIVSFALHRYISSVILHPDFCGSFFSDRFFYVFFYFFPFLHLLVDCIVRLRVCFVCLMLN